MKMREPIRIGILGYGNVGRGVAEAVRHNSDMELVAIFSRRPAESVTLCAADQGTPVVHIGRLEEYKDKVDVLMLCGGSATDLPEQAPEMAKLFHTVDSFDTHARIPEYFEAVDRAASESGHVSLISCGWDPGLFSMQRLLFGACLPDGADYTFWGSGVSQGHSDAIRRIAGVKNAIQYTHPHEAALTAVRNGENPELSTRQRHWRECFVVAEEGADLKQIEHDIVTMPNYFSDYDTTVHFITEEELKRDHSTMPHGGIVFRSGHTDAQNQSILEFSLKLDSNPQFTASVLVAFARAVFRLAQQGKAGAVTVFDIPLGLLSRLTPEEQRKTLL